MASNQLLHMEDVIFNTSSLKEFVRLIKNGTVHAIWPSTEEEFKAWNNGGFEKYAKGQPVKSQKTSLTVYFGDHDDAKSTGDINLDQTQKNFELMKSQVEEEKASLVSNKYYDNTDEIYPSNLKLVLNNTNGSINNLQDIINYKQNIIQKYQDYINVIKEFKSRVSNFKPNQISTSYMISDFALESDYDSFFQETTATTQNDFSNNILLKDTEHLEEYVKSILVDNETSICDFSLIEQLYSNEKNIIDILFAQDDQGNYEKILLKEHYNGISAIDTNAINQLLNIRSILDTKRNNILNLYSVFWQFFIANSTNINSQIAEYIQIPEILQSSITEQEIEQYLENKENGIELIINKYLIPYKEIFITAYALQDLENLNFDEANNYWDESIDAITTNIINSGVEDLEYAIDEINQKLIYNFNKQFNNIKIPDLPLISQIYFLDNQKIQDQDIIINNINFCSQYLTYVEEDIFENFETVSNTTLSRNSINLNELNQKKNAIIDSIKNLTEIIQDNGKTELQNYYNNIINYYENFIDNFNLFLSQIKNIVISGITPIENFIIENKRVSNIADIIDTVKNQKEKMLQYYDILNNVLLEEDTSISNNIEEKTQSLLDRLNSIVVDMYQTGDPNSLYNQGILDNYTLDRVNALALRIIGDTSLSFLEEKEVIPYLSTDGLEIANKNQIIKNLDAIIDKSIELKREYYLSVAIDSINNILYMWTPVYLTTPKSHYVCVSVGSDIQFPAKISNPNNTFLSEDKTDGSMTVLVDGEYHYPLVNGLANEITKSTRTGQVVTVGGLSNLFKTGTLPNLNTIGSHKHPIFYDANNGFIGATGVIQGTFNAQGKGMTGGVWVVDNEDLAGDIGLQATKLFGAVYNDYAEYRSAEAKPGRCIVEKGDGTLIPSTARLQLGANIVSDTYGFAIGETNDATCPVAVCGRVLVYPLEAKELFTPGAAVCSGPDGTISLMTREEIKEWPDAIVGYVSEIPTYDTWGTDNVPVDGRIWIKIK